MSTGAKLAAYTHIKLPAKRLPFILSRSFSRLKVRVECNCAHPPIFMMGGIDARDHWLEHWLLALYSKIQQCDEDLIAYHGWEKSVPFMLIAFTNEFFLNADLFTLFDDIR